MDFDHTSEGTFHTISVYKLSLLLWPIQGTVICWYNKYLDPFWQRPVSSPKRSIDFFNYILKLNIETYTPDLTVYKKIIIFY